LLSRSVVLISLIGKGKQSSGVRGYEKASYYFKYTGERIDTSLFGSAVYKTLLKQGCEVDKWLIFGTQNSNWSDVLFAVDAAHQDEFTELYCKVYDEENKGISDSTLDEWQVALCRRVPGIRLIKVDPLDYKVYINHMLQEMPDKNVDVVLDITHGFRHMPVIIAFSMMLLKYLKNITNISMYYGAFDMKDHPRSKDPVPVLKIDFINELVAFTENIAVFNNSSYFVGLLDLLGIANTEQTYFRLDMNRQPRKQLQEINRKLDMVVQDNDYRRWIALLLKSKLSPLLADYLDERMIERAKFFFDRKQYLKALILLYEGIILLVGRKYCGKSSLNYEDRNEFRNYIKAHKDEIFGSEEKRETFEQLEYTRNAAVHGSDTKGVQQYVEQLNDFKALFEQGLSLYEDISGERLS